MPLQKGFIAGGTIRPSRFVKMSGDSTVSECDAGDPPIGISQEWSRDVPRSDIATSGVNAALVNEPVRVYGEADICLLELGDTVAVTDVLQSDADGRGIPVAAATDESGAIPLEAGVVGDKIRVQVNIDVNN